MEMKKMFIIALVVIFGICFITALSSLQRMDSDQMMVDPENPSITAQAFSEPTDIAVSAGLRVPSADSGVVAH